MGNGTWGIRPAAKTRRFIAQVVQVMRLSVYESRQRTPEGSADFDQVIEKIVPMPTCSV